MLNYIIFKILIYNIVFINPPLQSKIAIENNYIPQMPYGSNCKGLGSYFQLLELFSIFN